jgi:uncharacterized sulfatase
MPGTTDMLYPLYGIDQEGIHHSEWAFTDIDEAPSKSFIIEKWQDQTIRPYFDLALDKRPEFELFDIRKDPFNLNNLSGKSEFEPVIQELKQVLLNELEKSGDPRITGSDKEIFDSYIRYSPIREFPAPRDERLVN